MKKIIIESGDKNLIMRITPILGVDVIEKIDKALPILSKVKTWGEEIYFETEVLPGNDVITLDASIGDVAYWPPGRCLCLFFGKTPMSVSDKPVPASGVVIVGRVDNLNTRALKAVREGDVIKVL